MFSRYDAVQYPLRKTGIFLFCSLFLTSGPLFAAGITVDAGSSFNLGGGSLNLDCGDLVLEGNLLIDSGTADGIGSVDIAGGQLTGGSGTVSLSGDWSNSGSFSPETSSVQIVDGCGVSESGLAGDNDFNHFSVTSTTGKLLQVEAGSSHYFASSLTLEGDSGNLLQIKSSVPGQEVLFSLEAGGTQSISAVDVSDNNAEAGQALAPGAPANSQSVDSGNNVNWFIVLPSLIFKDSFET